MNALQVTNAFEELTRNLTPRYGSGEANSIARIVFEDAFDIRKRTNRFFSPSESNLFSEIQARLLEGEPVQYVLGEADFFGLKFLVNPAVLIPRQETEELVAWVLEWLRMCDTPSPAVLDIGLGSGCIAVTLKRKRPEIKLFGLELSPEAYVVAMENARRLLGHSDFTFLMGNILDADAAPFFPEIDVVVSNPPYIPRTEWALIPEHVISHEPALALFVEDADPLVFYRKIAFFSKQKLRTGGRLFFECNEFNASRVAELLLEMGFLQIELRKDLSGADRMVGAVWANSAY